MFEPPPGPVVLAPHDDADHPLAPWFEHARRRRREHYAGRAPRHGTRALVTMVHNEAVFLPLWLRYYSHFFGEDDIYVLDNDSTDGSTGRGGFVRVPVAHDTVDHAWMVRTVEKWQHTLLERYDVVLVTDVDEIVVPAPALGTLGDYLDRFDEEWVNCLGYELLHVPGEPPLDLSRPILGQRRHWFFNDGYNKAALATVPLRWKPGFHGRADQQFNLEPDLRLVHLHRMDRDLCRERHRIRRRKPWAPDDAAKGWAMHNRLADDEAFDRWFDGQTGFSVIDKVKEIHPEWFGVF